MARLYADENFPFQTVDALRQMGHDVLTALEAGQANQKISDDQVLAFAFSDNRILLTYNRRDFIRLHNSQIKHSGIIVCTVDVDPIGLAARINESIESLIDLNTQLIRVNRLST